MKKILFFLLLCIGITFVGCSDDDSPKVPFQLVTEGIDGISGNTLNVSGYEDKTVEIPLKGVSESVSREITYDAANESEDGWLDVIIETDQSSGNKRWTAVVKVKGYEVNKQRKASVVLKSGTELQTLNIVQQGAPIPGQLKFATEQEDGFADGNFSLLSIAPKSVDINVIGITEGLTTEVRDEDKGWLGAEASAADSKITVSVTGYRGTEDRVGYVTLKSGIDELLLQVTQKAVGDLTEMVVVCEGNYGKGTAALSAISYAGDIRWDVFRDVTNKPLGDVAQSMIYLDGKYFVALNNSRQIKVIDPTTFELLGDITYTDAASPRFIVPINDKEALVSDLYKQVTIINYKDYTVVKHIPLTGVNQIEKMTRVGDKIFCAALGAGGLWVWDVNNIAADSYRKIAVRGIAKTAKMMVDKNGMLWVLGSYGVYEYPKLFCINPNTEEVIYSYEIPVISRTDEEKYVPGAVVGRFGYNRMDMDANKDKLYFVLQSLVSKGETAAADTKIYSVFTFDIETKELKLKTQLPSLVMMYGMNVSPAGEIYVCDALDYSQRGYVRHYKDNTLIDSKNVGVIPRMVIFTENNK